MSLSVHWDFAALAVFNDLHPTKAAEVARAVYASAETGVPPLRWRPPYHRLRVGGFEAALVLDREAETLTVLYLYRVRGSALGA